MDGFASMLTGRESDDLVAFGASVVAYCARPVPDGGGELVSDLVAKRALISMLEIDFARDGARFAAEYDMELYINPGPVSWLRENCHLTVAAAASAICVGEQALRLERSTMAASEGRIGFAHLGLLAATAAALEGSGAAAGFDEATLIGRAQDMSVRRFRDLCAHVRHAADREAFLATQLTHREWRTLELHDSGEEGVSLTGFLDSEGGAVVRSALEPLCGRAGAGDQRPREQRYADALVELCAHALDCGAVPQRASQRAHLQVTASLETLLDLVGAPAGEMEFGGVVAGATVQRLACDATITRVLLDPQSQVIDVGRSARVVQGSTRRVLNIRDGGCRWPGCERTPSWTCAHHVVHWPRGGPTDVDNLVLLCRHHHWSVHEGGWQLVRTGDGTIVTVSPLTGRGAPLRRVAGHGARAREPALSASAV